VANFQGHITSAAIGSGVLSSGLLSLGMLSTKESIVAFLIGTVGGLLPDVDSETSKPFRTGMQVFMIFIAFSVMFSKAIYYSFIEMAILWSGVYLFLRVLILYLFKNYTKHRGMFHSIPAGVLAGFIMTNLTYYFFDQNAIISWLYRFFIFFGYMIHLIMDEYVSINLFGKKVKKSLGTALKFYDKRNKISTISTYIAIILLFLLTPEFKEFKEIFADIELAKSLGDIVFPKGVWFEGFIKFK